MTAQPHYYPPGSYHRQYDAVASSIKVGALAGTMSPELMSPTNVGIHEKPATATSTANAKTTSESPQLSPVFKSEAAKQIIKEMTERTEKRIEGPRRRQIPREKRRHYTVSSSKPVLDLEDAFSKMVFFVSFNFRSVTSRPVYLCFACHSLRILRSLLSRFVVFTLYVV